MSARAAARVWVLDPIDGTRGFIAGRPIFGTLIALVEEGRPVLGVIDQPIARDRWLGRRGADTLLNGAPARTRRCPKLGQGAYRAPPRPRYSGGPTRALQKACAAAGDTLWGGDCHNYGLPRLGPSRRR